MKLRQLNIFIFFLSSLAFSENYWQQYVEYDMDVRLDTSKKTLFGSSKIVYQNNSPDTLYNFYLNQTFFEFFIFGDNKLFFVITIRVVLRQRRERVP